MKVLIFAQMDSKYHNENATNLKLKLSLENANPAGFEILLERVENIWQKTGKRKKAGLEKRIFFF